jgi:hypothetical protein
VPAQAAPRENRFSVEGFEGAVPLVGRWTLAPEVVRQLDGTALTAKLAVPLAQQRRPRAYTVTARSEGTGWVGVGLHVMVSAAEKHRGWGEGRSVLVWLTSDPKHRGDTLTRLQVYRSASDVDMRLERELVVPESVFEANEISVHLDPAGGLLAVFLNGRERLACGGFEGLVDGVAVVFRSIHRAEFKDFRVEELP